MPMQEPVYLSVKEAIDTTGVSDASIRRLCKKGIKNVDYTYQDNKLIILNTFLYEHYKPIYLPKQSNGKPMHGEDLPKQMPKQEPDESSTNGVGEILQKEYYQNLIAAKEITIQVVSEQLKAKEDQLLVKDNQLQAKDQQINQLIERTREQNIIIQSIQDKMAKQLPQATETEKFEKKSGKDITEPLLISVALLSAIALIGFIGLMIYAYLNR